MLFTDRQSMAVGVMSPLWNFVQPDTVCEGVLSSDELMDHLIKTDLNGYAEEFQVNLYTTTATGNT